MRTTIVTTRAHEATAAEIGGPGAEVIAAPVSSAALAAYVAQTDVLMIFLHPDEHGMALRNDAGDLEITIEQISDWSLAGATVFLGACYGLENELILSAFRRAGAAHIIAGAGVNIGGVDGLSGADLLAQAFRAALATFPAVIAWQLARVVVWLAAWREVPGAEDALEYRMDPLHPAAGLGGRLTRIIGTLLTLLAMAWALIFGSYEGPQLTTFFSSIINPPPGVTWWDKSAYVNDVEQPITDTIDLVDGDVLKVADWITASESFTLTEQWSTTAISLTSWITAGGGSVSTGSGELTWVVASPVTSTRYQLTKTWSVVAGSWASSELIETLQTSSERVYTLTLNHTASTATPTPVPTQGAQPTIEPTVTASPTPQPTFTPYYTATGWSSYLATAVPTPTPTPCVFGCDPLTSTAGVTYTLGYQLYLPVVARNYDPPSWTTELYVNGTWTSTSTTITVSSGDALLVRDIIQTGRDYTFTLAATGSSGLSLTDTLTNTAGAALTTGARSFDWTVLNYGGGTIDSEWSVGAGVTETITRTWTYVRAGIVNSRTWRLQMYRP
jgi:hypothetical protein